MSYREYRSPQRQSRDRRESRKHHYNKSGVIISAPDRQLLVIVAFLVVLGLLAIFSATAPKCQREGVLLITMAFKQGIYAMEEIGQYCIFSITFIGLSYAVTTGKHINMLGLFDMLPKKIQKADAFLISAVTGITMGILTVISFQYVSTLKMMGKVSINLHVPTWIVVAVIGCGFLFATIQYILVFIRNLQSKDVYLGLMEPYIPDLKREEAKEK